MSSLASDHEKSSNACKDSRHYPAVTIGICTRNNEKTVAKTLDSLSKLDYPPSLLQLIIVDGLSSDRTLEIVKNSLSGLEIEFKILSDQGLGIGYARQMIVDNTSNEFIAFIDADHCLHPRWLKAIIECLSSHDKAASVSGGGGTSITLGPTIVATLESYKNISSIVHALERKDLQAEEVGVWNYSVGNSVVRRSAIISVGGFDKSFRIANEDTDLAFRLAKNGWQLLVTKNAIISHQERTTWRSLFRQYRDGGFYAALVGKKYRQPYKSKKLLFLNTIVWSLFSTRHLFKAFKVTHDYRCILMPIEFAFTKFARFLGYVCV